MSKATAREQMEAWRAKCIEELIPLKAALSAVIHDVKRIRAAAKSVVAKTSMSSEMSSKLSQGVEDRQNDVHKALVKELGQEEADDLIDTDEYPDTSEEDERDDKTMALLDDIDSPDPEDLMDQVIDPLESLEEGIAALLASFKKLK